MKTQATTVLAVRHGGSLVMIGDGQVTVNETIIKQKTNKIRRLQNGSVLTGFAGSAVDGITLFQRFESKLEEYNGQLGRAAVELAKDWRTDRSLRRLEAMLIVGNKSTLYFISGAGDVLEPDDDLLAIGSGGNFALAAARALIQKAPGLTAREIAETAMQIAAEICPFTNTHFVIEEIS